MQCEKALKSNKKFKRKPKKYFIIVEFFCYMFYFWNLFPLEDSRLLE